VSVPPYCGVLAGVVEVVADVVVDVLLQEVSSEAEIEEATRSKLNPTNRIFFFTSFSPFMFSLND
jgi:hypothetical protein